MDIDVVLDKVGRIFPILNDGVLVSVSDDEVRNLSQELQQTLDIAENIYESVFLEIKTLLSEKYVPQFWKHLMKCELRTTEEEKLKTHFINFQESILNLEDIFIKFSEIVRRTSVFKQSLPDSNQWFSSEQEKLNEILRTILLSQIPPHFNDVVYSFYSISFKVFANGHQSEVEGEDEDDSTELIDLKCKGCEREQDNCRCQELVCAFNKTNESLSNLGLLDRLAGHTLTSLIQDRICTFVKDKCSGNFEKSHFAFLEKWLKCVVINWLTRIFNKGHLKIDESNDKLKELIKNFEIKLKFYIYEIYGNVIIDQFFSIIIDYPDSIPAINDLQICLRSIDLRKYLIRSLKETLEKRLLHPGVNTMDILTAYVAAIKAIRHLDNSGIILETVTEPVKEYLKRRHDTIRKVVTGLTEEGPTDLNEELAKGEINENTDKTKNELSYWENWQPDPVDATPMLNPAKNTRTADIISMVVDIYGSKDLFVSEYRNLLADRLLTQLDFVPDKEIRNLELLKLRFGENLLHNCEVMLKDISESKRINSHIQSDINYIDSKSWEMSSLIISAQFWPVFNKESLELPEEINNEFIKYKTAYESYKGNRTLCWREVTGRVNIEIEIGSKTLDMSVTPSQAVIIWHFQDKTEWTLEDLSDVMKVPSSVLRKRIVFWQTQGLIKEKSHDVYTLIEEDKAAINELNETSKNDTVMEDEESESAMASLNDQREEELQVFWSYIVGMLTNLDSLTLERIHQMLKMFASNGPTTGSLGELQEFLQKKVKQHELVFMGGVYHLPK
ncbi:ANAPC2 family protein [Megaselia abdita]